jgi:hypothetical protein
MTNCTRSLRRTTVRETRFNDVRLRAFTVHDCTEGTTEAVRYMRLGSQPITRLVSEDRKCRVHRVV